MSEDRNDEPGITWQPHMKLPPQISEFNVESMAAHSKSEGWLPCVKLTIMTVDGLGITGFLVVDDSLKKIIRDTVTCAERAVVDVMVAKKKGTLPDD